MKNSAALLALLFASSTIAAPSRYYLYLLHFFVKELTDSTDIDELSTSDGAQTRSAAPTSEDGWYWNRELIRISSECPVLTGV
jgi:hypothetical protein